MPNTQRIKAALLSIAAVVVISAHAVLPALSEETASGNYWLKQCADMNEPDCSAFLMGVFDYNSLIQVDYSIRIFCPPAGVTVGQLKEVALKWLRDNPASLHQPFATLAVDAFKKAFPCPSIR